MLLNDFVADLASIHYRQLIDAPGKTFCFSPDLQTANIQVHG